MVNRGRLSGGRPVTDSEAARRYLRRTLMLNPEGADSEAVRQRLSALGARSR